MSVRASKLDCICKIDWSDHTVSTKVVAVYFGSKSPVNGRLSSLFWILHRYASTAFYSNGSFFSRTTQKKNSQKVEKIDFRRCEWFDNISIELCKFNHFEVSFLILPYSVDPINSVKWIKCRRIDWYLMENRALIFFLLFIR